MATEDEFVRRDYRVESERQLSRRQQPGVAMIFWNGHYLRPTRTRGRFIVVASNNGRRVGSIVNLTPEKITKESVRIY